MRKVFLDDLPRKGRNISWADSLGHKINFIYDDIRGKIEITGYDKGKITIVYNNRDFSICVSHFKECKLGKILNVYTGDFKVTVGEEFKDEKRDMVIIDREYRKKEQKPDNIGRLYTNNQKWYRYKCNKCGWNEGWIKESNLIGSKKCGCSCCRGLTPILGINTIWDTDRWMVDLGVSEEDAKKYTRSSNKKIKVKCPNCGRGKNTKFNRLYVDKSIGCVCGDGFSYNEKFIYCLLKQLDVNFIMELSKSTFEWCKNYRYDFYLSDYSCIIETHGMQHYEVNGFSTVNGRELKEEQKNDDVKKHLAIKNNIKSYIVIDCRYSKFEYVKNSIINSELNKLFDLSKIDWKKCEEFALKNIVKEVCNYWNNKEEWETTINIAEIFKLNQCTIRRYLNKGSKLGWCNYDGTKEFLRNVNKNTNLNKKPVMVFKDGELIITFNSLKDVEKFSEPILGVKLCSDYVSLVCKGKRKDYKGLTFKYASNHDMLNNNSIIVSEGLSVTPIKNYPLVIDNPIKEVCEYWNSKRENETTTDLSKIFNLDKSTIIKYLKKGREDGLCLYNPREEMRKCFVKNNIKPVYVYKNNVLIASYDSVNEAGEKSHEYGLKISPKMISYYINERRGMKKEYLFSHKKIDIDDTEIEPIKKIIK